MDRYSHRRYLPGLKSVVLLLRLNELVVLKFVCGVDEIRFIPVCITAECFGLGGLGGGGYVSISEHL